MVMIVKKTNPDNGTKITNKNLTESKLEPHDSDLRHCLLIIKSPKNALTNKYGKIPKIINAATIAFFLSTSPTPRSDWSRGGWWCACTLTTANSIKYAHCLCYH
jgi:hypothetical protein